MKAKLSKLKLVSNAPDPNMVRMMRRELARVERGDVVGVGMALVQRDGTIATCYAMNKDQYSKLVSASSRLTYRLHEEW